MAKILTTDNKEHIKEYVIKNQDMTLDKLLNPKNKKNLLSVKENPSGGEAAEKESKSFKGNNNEESTYKKYETEVKDVNNGSISPIQMYLKRENVKGVSGSVTGKGKKGYTGCQDAADSIKYDPSTGELTLVGVRDKFSEEIEAAGQGWIFSRYCVVDWLKINYPNKTFAELPKTIDLDENKIY